MTKQKKLLLICGIIFAPVLALIALILRVAALFTEYDKAAGYFTDGSVFHTAYLWVLAVSVTLFLVLAILCRKEIPTPTFRGSLSILFSGAFFLVTLAVSALSGFLSLSEVEAGLTQFFAAISALGALVSLVYFGLFFRRDQAQGVRHGLLGLAPAFFFLFTAILLYFDRTTQMNDPAKLLYLATFVLLACYFLGESRGILGHAYRPFYYFLTATALLFSASASIPSLLYNLIEGKILVLTSVYDFVLLAAALYSLARLLQLLPYEYPSVHRMVQQFLQGTAEAATEEEAEKAAPAASAEPNELAEETEEPANAEE